MIISSFILCSHASLNSLKIKSIKNSVIKPITIELKPTVISSSSKTILESMLQMQVKEEESEEEEKKLGNTQIESVQIFRKLTEYSGTLKIGNPPQLFDVVFDTGSANIIIPSTDCNTKPCQKHNKFDFTKSKSVNRLTQISANKSSAGSTVYRSESTRRDEVIIHFGTGAIQCDFTQDTVCIGELCSEKQTILTAINESDNPFTYVKFDGIVGLSFSHLSVNKEANFMDMLHKQKKISEKVFAFYFNKNDKSPSQLTIGGIDTSKFIGELNFSKVISPNYWEIKIDAIYYGKIKLNLCEKIMCSAILDTGTSMIAAPTEITNMLLQHGQANSDCSNYNDLQSFKFVINGVYFILDREFYIMKINEEIMEKEMGFLKEDIYDPKSLKCVTAFMNLDAIKSSEKTRFVFGGPFIKKFYSVFDRENNRIGLAEAKH